MESLRIKEEIVVIIPVYQPDRKFHDCLASLRRQRGVLFQLHVVVSGSLTKEFEDDLAAYPRIVVERIDPRDFNHGGTREKSAERYGKDSIFVFMTQDAIPASEHAVFNLVKAFENQEVGCAYGRQLPQSDASPFAAFARQFNYRKAPYTRRFEDRGKFGMKTCFLSNSFSAYRGEALFQVGGFPTSVILSEDMYVCAKMLIADWSVSYVADACVYHSHNYTIRQEFRRYFDIGVFHARESWIRSTFGNAEGEGFRFLEQEIDFLRKKSTWLLCEMVVRDAAKFVGYRLGILEKFIPALIKHRLSMTKSFWNKG